MIPHLVEEEEEDVDSCLSHPTILTIPLLSQILLLVRLPTMSLPPMTTTMESTAMVLPPIGGPAQNAKISNPLYDPKKCSDMFNLLT
jgi:hypothetical protein